MLCVNHGEVHSPIPGRPTSPRAKSKMLWSSRRHEVDPTAPEKDCRPHCRSKIRRRGLSDSPRRNTGVNMSIIHELSLVLTRALSMSSLWC
ncbi:hypothetical protein NDU88_000234 [Pleurodeles waltl]|uniref:Uncharacterized protein n=1 Tax=Pleurodeles waltl TaxID=8319 RepID=A0AAV7NBJ9_PLEWA|nr:hypothetical protein NDU88_000234 [Pleurodeles waltl]